MTTAAMDLGGLELEELILAGDDNAWSLEDWDWDPNAFTATPKAQQATATRRRAKRHCSGARLGLSDYQADLQGSGCQTWTAALNGKGNLGLQASGNACCAGLVGELGVQSASASPSASIKQQAASPSSSISETAAPRSEPATPHSELVLPTGPLVCQVEGCGRDLSSLSVYYQRCRICEVHIKEPEFMRAGKVQRFCQQCGRCHELSAFHGAKRSCRDQLAKHNARRRRRAEKKNAATVAAEQQAATLPATSPCSSRLADHFASLGPFLQPLGNQQAGEFAIGSSQAFASQPVTEGMPASSTAGMESMVAISLPGTEGQNYLGGQFQPQASLDLDIPGSYGLPSSYFPGEWVTSMPMTSGPVSAPSASMMRTDGGSMNQPDVVVGIPVGRLGEGSSYDQAMALMGPASPQPPAYQPENLVARLSVKLFSCTPAELPSDLQQQLTGWLKSTPAGAEGYLRPGCVHLTLQAHISADCAAEVAQGGIRAVAAHLASQANPVWHRRAILLELNGQMALMKSGRLVSSWDLPSLRAEPQPALEQASSSKTVVVSSHLAEPSVEQPFSSGKDTGTVFSPFRQPAVGASIISEQGDSGAAPAADGGGRPEAGLPWATPWEGHASLSTIAPHGGSRSQQRKACSAASVVPQLDALSLFAIPATTETGGMQEQPTGANALLPGHAASGGKERAQDEPAEARLQLFGRGIACADCTVLCRLQGRYVGLRGGPLPACCQPGQPHSEQVTLQALDIKIPHEGLTPGVAWLEVQRGCLLSRPLPLVIAPSAALAAELNAHRAAASGGAGGIAPNPAALEGLASDLGLLLSRVAQGVDLAPLASTAARLLEYAADAGLPALAAYLLSAAGKLCIVQTASGALSLLHRCARSRSTAVLEVLLSWGKEEGHTWQADAAGPSGLTPLHLAALASDGGALARALATRCSPGPTAWLCARTTDGATPADFAARAEASAVDVVLTALARHAAKREDGSQQKAEEADKGGRSVVDGNAVEQPASSVFTAQEAASSASEERAVAWQQTHVISLRPEPARQLGVFPSLSQHTDAAPLAEGSSAVHVASENESSVESMDCAEAGEVQGLQAEAYTVINVSSEDESAAELMDCEEAGESRALLTGGGYARASCAGWGGPLAAMGHGGLLGKWANVSLLAMVACTFACLVLLRDWVV